MSSREHIFPWNSYFDTGIDEIDEQHKNLVDIVNQLASHLENKANHLQLNQVLDELTNYTIYHFQSEETIWAKSLPSDEMTVNHQDIHRQFIDKVVEFRSKYDLSPDSQVAAEILYFLTNWLAFHIIDTDRHMAEMVFAIQSGKTIAEAKELASEEMSGATHLLIETVLKMYASLSSRTLDLILEINRRQRAEQNLKLSKNAIDSSLEEIFITDDSGIIIDANPSFCTDSSRQLNELIGQNIRSIKPSIFHDATIGDIWTFVVENGSWAGEVRSENAGGDLEAGWLSFSAVRDNEGKATHFSGVLSTASQVLERKNKLEIEANFDPLTGLPNRRLFHDRLKQAIERSKRSGEMLAICFLDLDGFKAVNDTLGHDAGDAVLCTTASRIEEMLRSVDTVARLGGDEFVLLLEGVSNLEDMIQLLDKILYEISLPITTHGKEACVSASMGVVHYPCGINDPVKLMKLADVAMYDAKKSGKSQYKIWNEKQPT